MFCICISYFQFLSTSLLGASRSYFFPSSPSTSSFFSYPPWNFLIFYINYTKIISLSSLCLTNLMKSIKPWWHPQMAWESSLLVERIWNQDQEKNEYLSQDLMVPNFCMESNGSRTEIWKRATCSNTHPQQYHDLHLIYFIS